jgi:flagella basal body P-ring formation protein FlgA
MDTTWRRGSRVLALACTLATLAPAALAQERASAGAPRAARAIARGAVLTHADIAVDSSARADSSVAGAASVAPGWVARRVIAAGEPLRPPAVAPPPVVRTGDTVQVVWAGGTVRLSTRGQAANAAAAGERVTVRLDDGRRIEGQATESGEVQIP